MTIIYEVTWSYGKDNQWPTDEFPPNVDVLDSELQRLTARRAVYRYELKTEADAFTLERGLDNSLAAPSCVSYRRLRRGSVR
jgi:hypothetical protein